MIQKSMDAQKRKTLCFLLCMLCTFCTDLHMMVYMNNVAKLQPYTSPIQTVAALTFLALAIRRPMSKTAKWHLGLGIALVGWAVIAKYFHGLFGEPREYLGVFVQRFLVLLPFGALMQDEKSCQGLKGAGVLTLGVCGYLCFWALLLFLNLVPGAMQECVYWSGARMNPLWNPIIFAVIMFTGIALCVAGCFLARKLWQRAALLAFAVVQFLFISMTHSRTVVLVLCAFVAGTAFFALGQGSIQKRIAWALVGIAAAAALFGLSEAVYNANNQHLIGQLEASGAEFRINDQGYITDGVTNQGSLKEDMGSLNGRTETWKIVLDAVKNNRELRIFGTSQFRKNIREDMAHSHNSWLEMLVYLGIPGLLLSLILTAEILIALARVFLFCRNKAQLVLALFVLCMLPIGIMEPFLFCTAHLGDLFILTGGYLWAWGTRETA